MELACLGGYDFKFIADVTTYYCLICRLVAKDVHQLSCCGKLICKDCLDTCIQRCGNTCPHCRNEFTFFRDTRSCQEIFALTVECRNITHGCTQRGDLKMMITHHEKCTYEVCVCNACKQQVPKAIFKEHAMAECPRRNFHCPYCNTFGPYEEIVNAHYGQCPKYPVTCHKCGLEMVREKLECHAKSCPKELVPCPYPACSIQVTREELPKHKEVCPMKHGDTNSTSGELSNEAEEQYTLPLKFGIEKVSELGDDQWTSPGFYTHSKGYRMCLKVHLGSYQERGDYLSCFLHLMSGPYDAQLEWPFRAQFEVVLMNQNKDEPDWSRDINFFTCSVSPCNSRVQIQNGTCMAMGIGDPQYIKWQKLDEGYLLNDKLVFAIKCKAMPQFGVHCQSQWLAHHDIPPSHF